MPNIQAIHGINLTDQDRRREEKYRNRKHKERRSSILKKHKKGEQSKEGREEMRKEEALQ
jgi:hypothetical protein